MGVNVEVHISVFFSEIRFNIILASEATFLQLSTQNLHKNIPKFPFNTVTILNRLQKEFGLVIGFLDTLTHNS